MTIDQLLKVEQFNFLISPYDTSFFVNKSKEAENLRIVFQSDLSTYMMTGEVPVPEYSCFDESNSDTSMTAVQGSIMKNIIALNKEKSISSLLALYFGAISQKYLKWILDAENGKHQGRDEFCYNDGEIVVVDRNNVSTNKPGSSTQSIKSRLAEGVLIAASEFQNTKRPITRNGIYYGRGLNNVATRETIDSGKLKAFAKSKETLSSLDQSKFAEYIRSGLLKKWDVLRYIERGMISADIAIDLMIEGVFNPSDIYAKALNVKNESELASSEKISFLSKLYLYSNGKMKIADLERAAKFEEKRKGISLSENDIKKVAKYYKGNINKISELLTHNVLDFTVSMAFLDGLINEGIITSEEKDYLVNIINDFKTSELLNGTENQRFESSRNVGQRPKAHSNGVTIDPNLRKDYFASIGDVKEIFINGERLISDESEDVSEKNSIDGYQLIIIPDKKIAILEKFYEVTRNKDGKLEYKKDKNGNYIAATEHATYIMPIAVAKDFAETKNKQELMKSPYVARTLHSMNWVINTENAMTTVARRAGLDIEFDRKNTDKWADKTMENYKKLREKRMLSIDDLI